MPPRPRPLSQHDRDAWAAYVQQVRALAGRALPVPPLPPLVPAVPPVSVQAVSVQAVSVQAVSVQAGAVRPAPAPLPPAASRRSPPAPALVTGQPPAGLDRATWGRLHGGKLAPSRTLDLHGKTAQAAFHALESFLLAAHADRLRCVEVITGRGSGETGGVIRRELPLWLNLPRLRPLVLASTHPHPRNLGSLLLLIRRVRSDEGKARGSAPGPR